MAKTKKRVGILISGRGSNMMSLIAAAREPDYPAEVVCVLSNRPEAEGLSKAAALGIRTGAFDHKSYGAREGFEADCPQGHWRHDREEGPAGGMTGRGVHVVDAMLCLAGRIEQVTAAQSVRLVQDFGIDDTTSMLFRFAGGATGYLGTVIATAFDNRGARCWRSVEPG